jgi:DNA polymerase-4
MGSGPALPSPFRHPATPLCRDCLSFAVDDSTERRRCLACGSPRLLAHPERDTLTVAHVDCDAFYAAIEKRDDPSLADKPVIVGGRKRGVVSTACYVARTFGVRSAMPMFKALRACPDAVVIKPNMEKYASVGREVRALMLELTPLVEPISIDEAFLDLAGTAELHQASPAVALARFAVRVERKVGITVSIGLAPNKFLAKIASDLDTPRGFSVIGRVGVADFLAPKRASILPGVGAAAMARLEKAGIRTVGDLARADPKSLAARLGSDAERLQSLARGVDFRSVTPEHDAKTISAETTFDVDIAAYAKLEAILLRLSEKVASRLKKSELAGRSITLKLKTAEFRLRTRTRSLTSPTQLAGRIFEVARAMLRDEADGTRFRLIGVGAGDICEGSEADHGDLADPNAARDVHMEEAIDRVRSRFGGAAIERGLVFAAKEERKRR